MYFGLTADSMGFPHTRGGGPDVAFTPKMRFTFSPHAWGWTGKKGYIGAPPSVFPTRVGVDLRRCRLPRRSMRFPHTRGGGPRDDERDIVCVPFSPHAWGWTAVVALCNVCFRVFPTRVGVDREEGCNWQICVSFPHTRGGGPHGRRIDDGCIVFSPHAWGWTG